MPVMYKMKITFVPVAVVLLAFAFMSKFSYSNEDNIFESKNIEDFVLVGKKLFNSTGCTVCHGKDARGGIGKDLTQSKKNEKQMAKTIANGVKGTMMGSFQSKLSAGEIEKIIMYIKSLAR